MLRQCLCTVDMGFSTGAPGHHVLVAEGFRRKGRLCISFRTALEEDSRVVIVAGR